MKAAFYALGCKVNQYEADCCASIFRRKGYEIGAFDEKCDVYVVNTCSVTNIGDRKSRQVLRRAKQMNPDAIVVASGCYAQTHAEEIKKMPEVDIVAGTANRHLIPEMVEGLLRGENPYTVCNIMKERLYEELESEGTLERTRAYIKIQDGCDNFCSYCIVPYARGPVRSRRIENIKKEALRLSEKGFFEVVLTGISVASYGKDLPEKPSLQDAVRAVCEIENIRRVRLSSIDPRAFTKEFISFLANEKKICRHFHISLQSGSDTVLARMNRKYTRAQYAKYINDIRLAMPDAAITTDVICGFPGETEDEFEQTKAFVKEIGFSKVHVFPYSQRSKTAAAQMVQLPMTIRENRAHELSKICESLSAEFEKGLIGSRQSVLFEQTQNGISEGLAKNYQRVYVYTKTPLDGKIADVKIGKTEGGKLFADLI